MEFRSAQEAEHYAKHKQLADEVVSACLALLKFENIEAMALGVGEHVLVIKLRARRDMYKDGAEQGGADTADK